MSEALITMTWILAWPVAIVSFLLTAFCFVGGVGIFTEETLPEEKGKGCAMAVFGLKPAFICLASVLWIVLAW